MARGATDDGRTASLQRATQEFSEQQARSGSDRRAGVGAGDLALAILIVLLLAYFGPSLDGSSCLIGACGLIKLDDEFEPLPLWELVFFWSVVGLMICCTVFVLCMGAGYLFGLL